MSDADLSGAGSSTYANVFTYMGLPLSRDLGACDAVVMGLPYDLATSARPGARFGPNAIRQASAQLRWEKRRWPWQFALKERLRVIDYGDLSFAEGDSADLVETAAHHSAAVVAAGKFLLSFGGDHFVSLPLLRGITKKCGKLALLHFDAHTDTEETDLEYYHGSMFYRALQEELLDPSRSIQLGIRTEFDSNRHELEVLDAPWVNSRSADDAVARIRQRIGDAPVYLSIDIDCLDPAYAPGTGTPVAGGMTTDKLLQIVRGLGDLDIVAADVTEVAPAYDPAEITALAAATVALEILYLKAARAAG
ncbi:MAG: agmatinase [Gammaproteobacteria bacterium]|nr:agmatinase [Gammaproteobacteria bacterium]